MEASKGTYVPFSCNFFFFFHWNLPFLHLTLSFFSSSFFSFFFFFLLLFFFFSLLSSFFLLSFFFFLLLPIQDLSIEGTMNEDIDKLNYVEMPESPSPSPSQAHTPQQLLQQQQQQQHLPNWIWKTRSWLVRNSRNWTFFYLLFEQKRFTSRHHPLVHWEYGHACWTWCIDFNQITATFESFD